MKKHLLVLIMFTWLFPLIAIAQITSAGSGNWNAAATWTGGVIPSTTDNVIIANGHKVTINSNVTVASITIGQGASGILTFDNVASRAIIVSGNVTIASGASFVTNQITTTGNTNTSSQITGVASTAGLVVGMSIGGTGMPAGTTITAFDATTITLSIAATATATGVTLSIGYDNTLSIGGNLTNNGTFDMSLGNSVGICNVTFNNKTGNQAISGSGVTTRFRQIVLDKAAIANKVSSSINVSTAGGNILFTAGTWEQNAGRLNASGTLNIGSATTVVTACALNVIGSGSVQITSNLNDYGTLLVNTSDSVIVGSGTSKIDLTYVIGAVATFSKGTVLIYGKMATAALTNTTINGANIIIDPKGFTTTDYAFRATTGTGGTNPFTFTSGTITILNPNSTANSNPELAMSSSVAPNISGTATFVLGQGANTVASAQGFKISLNSAGILNNLTINTGSVGIALQTNVTLNGKLTITSSGAFSGSFLWKAPYYLFNGNVPQVTGTIMPDTVKSVAINNLAGVTSSKSLAITDTLFLLSGKLTGPYSAGKTVTGTNGVQENIMGLPQEFSLSQNYPNPFNPSTEINYEIPINEKIILKIYNNIGQELKTLVNEYQSAGRYTVQFNSDKMPSGVYFYRLFAGNFIDSKKMVIIK